LRELNDFTIEMNQIKILPLEIINLINLKYFCYKYNPIENILNPIIKRFLDKFKDKILYNMYNDKENVHLSSIQQSIKQSIYNLMNNLKEPINYNYLDDPILTEQTKKILLEYSKEKTIHTELKCTFNEILDSIFFEINKLNESIQIEVKKRINEEMEDSLNKCFTGRISRLVNSLSGFSDNVLIKILSSEEIANVILIMKTRFNNIDEIKRNVSSELILRGYEEKEINEWLEYID
jgi:hypothetical protein